MPGDEKCEFAGLLAGVHGSQAASAASAHAPRKRPTGQGAVVHGAHALAAVRKYPAPHSKAQLSWVAGLPAVVNRACGGGPLHRWHAASADAEHCPR